jgi:2-oxoglutarate dehydrogenase E1 component
MGEPKPMLPATPLAAGNAAYIEELYERYLADPSSVAEPWRKYFASLGGQADRPHTPLVAELARGATTREPATTTVRPPSEGANAGAKQAALKASRRT